VADPVTDTLVVTVEDDRREKQPLGTLRINLSEVLERTRFYNCFFFANLRNK